MEMLDASLAFVLTLAALATIVTVIIEALHRLLKIRKSNLILVLRKLSIHLAEKKIITNRDAWEFIVNVLNNKACAPDQQLPLARQLESDDSQELNITTSALAITPPDVNDDKSWGVTVDSLGRKCAIAGVFDGVSLEHVLRRYVELDEVKKSLNKGSKAIVAEIDYLARKYEEYASSAAADFKRRSKLLSVILGILLALVVNISAPRIFETYINNKNLTARVIGQFEEFEQKAKKAQDHLIKTRETSGDSQEDNYQSKLIQDNRKQLRDYYTQLAIEQNDQKRQQFHEQIKQTEEEYKKLLENQFTESELGKAETAIKDAGEQLRSLSKLGVPIGPNYFPHCLFYDNCVKGEEPVSLSKWIIGSLWWLMVTIISGVLIGLGAPFWFDVAKRLAAVRTMFGGQKDTELRLSGRDADGNTKERKKLVRAVVKDALSDEKTKTGNK